MRSRTPRTAWIAICLAMFGTVSVPQAKAQNATDDLRLYYSGNGLLTRGLYDLAIDEYRGFLNQFPDHEKAPVAQYGLAVALHRTNQFQDATPLLQALHALPEFEFAPEVALLLGQSYMAQHQYEEAVEPLLVMATQYQDAPNADIATALACESLFRSGQLEQLDEVAALLEDVWPQSNSLSRARYFHGLSLMHRQRFEEATDRFGALINDDADGPYTNQSQLLRASCLEQTGSLQAALRTYRAVLDSGIEQLSPDALLGVAAVLLRLDEPEQAARALDTYLADHDSHPQQAHALHLRGRASFDEGDYEDAIEFFDAAAQSEEAATDNSAYWAAKSALRTGDAEIAAQRLDRTLTQDNSDEVLPLMLYDHAVACTRSDRADDALDSISALLDSFPEHELAPQALQLRASTQHQLKNYAASQRASDAFLNDFSWHPLAESAAFLAAENRFLQDNFDDAADAYETFLSDYPESTQSQAAQFRLGDAHYRLGQYNKAQQQLAALVDDRTIPDAYHTSLWMLGQIAFSSERYDDAASFFVRYLRTTPASHAPDDAMLKLGISQQRLDHHGDAIATFTGLLRDYPESDLALHARFERGQSAMSQEAFGAAATDFQAVLDEDPDSRFAPYALNHLGSMALTAGQFESASLYFDQATDNAPQDIAAQTLLRQGQSLLADEQYSQALHIFESYLEQYTSTPDASTARAQRAIALARLGNHRDAVDAINDALNQSGSLDRSLTHSLQHEKIRALRSLGQDNEALLAARALHDENPDAPLRLFVMVDLAQLESAAGNHAAAAMLLDVARPLLAQDDSIESTSLLTQATYIQAIAEYNRAQYAQAATLFGEYLDQGASEELAPEAMLLQGESFIAIGKHPEASDVLREVTQLSDDDAILAPALLRLGESQAVLQRWVGSDEAFQRFVELYPDHELWYQARFGIGWACENQGLYDDAARSYQLVAERHQGPTAARAQFQLGECLFAQDLHEEAIREFLRVDVLYDYPEWSAAALYEAGQCFMALRRLEDARQQFELVATDHTDTRWGQLAQQRLDSMPEIPALPGR